MKGLLFICIGGPGNISEIVGMNSLASLIEQIDLLKKEIDSLRPIHPDRMGRIMQKFRLEWNFHSNHIEGNSLTYGETKSFLLHGITANGKPFKDHLDIKGHNEAILWIEEVIKEKRPLTETFIRELHKMILKESYRNPAITEAGQRTTREIKVGQYKTTANHVKTATGELFYFASPEETPAKMQELIEWYRTETEKGEMHPLILATSLHFKFIAIHPFDDGNGRVTRILMNMIFMQNGYPPVIIQSSKEKRGEYYQSLQKADGGDLEAFMEFVGTRLIRSLELMIKGAKGENIEEEDDLDKKLFLLDQKLSNTKVTHKKTPESFWRANEELIAPLVYKSIQKLRKFDRYFHENRLDLFINGSYRDINFRDTASLSEFTKALANILLEKTSSKIDAKWSWNNFKRAGMSNIYCSFHLKIEIKLDKIVIEYPANINAEEKKSYSFLYLESPPGTTLANIVNEMGDMVYEQLQKQIAAKESPKS